jgi:hypothetical protein
LIKIGKYANIPIISGCASFLLCFIPLSYMHTANLDEGTWFTANPETPFQITSFLAQARPALAFSLSLSAATPLLSYYPDNPALGSPYGTGTELFGRAKEYKRAASLVGDLIITVSDKRFDCFFADLERLEQAPRRAFIGGAVLRKQQAWYVA